MNYRGAKFGREQLVYVTETILIGILNQVECSFPAYDVTHEDRCKQTNDNPTDLSWYEEGALATGGMTLAIFYANLTGDGLGVGDALVCADCFEKAVREYVALAWKGKGKNKPKRPNTRKHAEAFVTSTFEEDGYFEEE